MHPLYCAFFERFNRGQFFEAHEVLETLWLQDRRGPDGDFLKGLIQLAGAFVHVQKVRWLPAASLLRLARGNLARFGTRHRGLDVGRTLAIAERWIAAVESRRAGHAEALPALPALAPDVVSES